MKQDNKSTETEGAASRFMVWERHGQSLLLAIITAALLGTVSILYNSNATQAAMANEMRSLSTQVAELRGTVSAMQLNYVTRNEFVMHMQRLQALEQRR